MATRRKEVAVRAPAKINLVLGVGPRRRDGYHELATLFHAVSLFDDLVASRSSDFTVEVSGEMAHAVPLDESNLALRAARLLAEHAGISDGVHLRLTKAIPVTGGMAGGSADAAAALVACDALWQTGYGRAELARLAADLGSDVPFSLVGGTAIGTGRGEQVSPVLARGGLHWVIGLADGELSTAAVFAEIDRLREHEDVPPPSIPPQALTALRSGDPVALGQALSNDLHRASMSLRPELADTLDVGRREGALGAVVCGSGPTVAFLVRDHEQALDLSVALSASATVRAVRPCQGPVPGARVVEPVMHSS